MKLVDPTHERQIGRGYGPRQRLEMGQDLVVVFERADTESMHIALSITDFGKDIAKLKRRLADDFR